MQYYAVHRGHETGIFKTWEECKNATAGYRKARFKKFSNPEEAAYFVETGLLLNKLIKQNTKQDDSDKKKLGFADIVIKQIELNNGPYPDGINIYTDGSLIRKGKKISAGYGIYVPTVNIRISRPLLGKKTNNRAELTAIIEAIKLLPDDQLNIYTDSKYSIYIVTGTGKRYLKNNRTDVPNLDLIQEVLGLLKGREIRFF